MIHPASAPPSPSVEFCQRVASGDGQAFRLLLDGWEPVIENIARRCATNPSDLPDLLQCGRLAIAQAAIHFDHTAGFPFDHYAKRAVKNNVRREAARLVRQRSLESRLDDNPNRVELAAMQAARRGEVRNTVTGTLADLPQSQLSVFRLLFVEGLTQRAAAKLLGVSQPRISQVLHSLLEFGRSAFVA